MKRLIRSWTVWGLVAALALAGWTGVSGAAGPMVKAVKAEPAVDRFTLRVSLTAGVVPKLLALGMKTDNPKLVVDFPGAGAPRSLPEVIRPKSHLVEAIRIGIHKSPKPMVRLVLDLVPGSFYQADQWFRKDNNTYILVLTVP